MKQMWLFPIVVLGLLPGCANVSGGQPLRPTLKVHGKPAASDIASAGAVSILSTERQVRKVSLVSNEELRRALVVAADHLHGELERELHSRRNKQATGFKFGGISRVERRYVLPTVLIGNEIDSKATELSRSVAAWKRELADLPRPPRPIRGEAVDDPHASERATLNENIGKYEGRSVRLRNFEARHRSDANRQHCAAIVLEEYIVDLIHVPIIDDVNVHAELKLFLFWGVRDGRLFLEVADLRGDDLWAETGHLVAVIAGFGGKGVPVNIAKRLGWTNAGLQLQNVLPDAIARIREANGLLPSVSIEIDDVALEGGEIVATLSWGPVSQ